MSPGPRDNYPKLPNFWFGRLENLEISDHNRRVLIYQDFNATGIDPGTKPIPNQLLTAEPQVTQVYRTTCQYTRFTFDLAVY
ncbi:hypothetical protein Plhal304r1_c001g0000951 [Plasmopara halstedii]